MTQIAGDNVAEMTVLGARVAAHHGDPEGEYRAMRERCAVVDLSWFSAVRASGADHREYLNRRLSQKVDDLPDGRAVRATLLGAEGRMQGDFELVADCGGTLILSTPASSGAEIAGLLDRYVFTEDARFADESGGVSLRALVGPGAEGALGRLGLSMPGAGVVAAGVVEGVRVLVWRCDFAGGNPVLAAPPGGAVEGAILAAAGARAGFLAFDTVRIEAGVPWWGLDLDERTIPLDANLLHALSFEKGCYPGQETVAKIMNLGHPARQLRGVVLDAEDPPAPRTPLSVEGGEAGVLTSSTWSPRLGRSIGLAMVRWPHRQAGTRVGCGGTTGTIVELPFA